MAQQSDFKNVRLYETEQYITMAVARDLFEGNESQAIRHMIRDYGKRNLVAEPQAQPAGNGQTALVDPPGRYHLPGTVRIPAGRSDETE